MMMVEEQEDQVTPRCPGKSLEEMIRIGSCNLADLIGLKLLAVVEINSLENGWSMKLEFLEREGIPNTMDIIGLYEAAFDQSGQLLNYARIDMRKRGDTYN
jgi:hypothetical protein